MGTVWWRSLGAAFFAATFLYGSCNSEPAPYPTFAREATLAPPIVFYDYIVVGGGTSGCALAATLSEGANVLLLERGGLPYGNPHISNIRGFAASLLDNSPTSASQTFVSTDGVINHRARVLGGGSALNAGFYTRASTDYVRRVGWDQKLVNESYEWAEKKVAFRPPMLAWQSAVRDGLLEAGVLPYNGFTFDHIYGTKVGGTIFDKDGHRHTAADLLEYADPTKITVYLNATVYQILFRIGAISKGSTLAGLVNLVLLGRPRAYGVLYRDAKGQKHVAYLKVGLKNEIILSAGALGSPQLLMLSGIGPAEHLRAQRIRVVLDQPMVGQGMADNPMNALVIPSPEPVELSLIQVVGIPRFESYIEAASGTILAWAPRQAGELMRSMNQVSVAAGEAYLNSTLQAGVILEKIAGPFSTGHMELETKDPNDTPRVTFNYFKNPQDLQRCVDGMNTIIKVINSESFSRFRFPLMSVQDLIDLMVAIPVNLRPRRVGDTVSMEDFCVDTVMTIWHYHGGCQVGRVVDRDYRVLGVDALRVVDGSTYYDSPGTNPQATCMMLGRYVGQRILDERS
ncbi:hypothetical protein RJ640_022949 [Escallonia rubra]|uniref:Glucose-methanol-choline oxidoreductase N-terminal domain-containing protein n=1 Tax=Escallonia rubra TaxID=112253 RepID=A0AA88RLC5_9ASTE|nr:hypothetical protein RJ640_022949 [Escallonia rubra]